ncbi:MAG TPA: transglutaminaseTgpA domain-containing protein [Acidimicrobiia bacterium]|nr:transglutaminaseTgpA domain-containing protein [Acidimicrobiia bacterium]
MDNRLGRIAGIAAFVLMLLRLGRLLDTGTEAPAWQLIMIASAFLGGVIWWLLRQTVSSRRVVILVFSLAGAALFMRISVSHTLVAGFVPTADTLGALGREMSQALDLIRFGVAPVFPTSGIVAILSILMWLTGALYVWGAAGGPSIAMIVPPFGLYLQFAVMDRVPAGRGWMAAAGGVMALAIASIGVERRHEAGRVRDLEGRPLARRAGVLAVVVALVVAVGSFAATDNASSLVPENGNMRWRYGGGYGPGFGGVSFDRLADLQQSVIRRNNTVLFRATLDPQAPPANEIYWRMESLDYFDGTAWRPSASRADFYEPGVGGGDPEHAYQGTTRSITQRVQVVSLRSQVIPTAGIGQFFRSSSVNVSGFQITPDGSAVYQAQLDEGDEYEVQAVLTMSKEDLGALATRPDGSLSPLFANASDAGVSSIQPGEPPGEVTVPSDIDRFLELPQEMPVGLTQVARLQTAGATTPFEAAWLLQRWFRDSGDFTYSTDVTTGHANLDLEDWLTEPTSINYRVGYCEQFAAAMAVLGRWVGIPSRVVWGFTPGTVEQQSDGTDVVVVRDNNAHAWVEMWMNGFGWVRFDPTPRGDGALPESLTAEFDPVPFLPPPGSLIPLTLDQPNFFEESLNPLEGTDLIDNPIGERSSGIELSWAWLALPILALLVGLVPLIKGLRRRRRLGRLRKGDITAAWDEIVDRLADLGSPVPSYQTPLEFATATDRSLVPLAVSYSAAVYGNRNGHAEESDLVNVETWIKLRYESGSRTRAAFNPRSLLGRE